MPLRGQVPPCGGRVPGRSDTCLLYTSRLAKIMGRIPAKTVGDPMDVGMCAAFLCSDAARYISGSCIPVDLSLIHI